jgi:hypothetical protein
MVSPTELTFTPENRFDNPLISVTGVPDTIEDGAVTFEIILTTTSEDSAYQNLESTILRLQNLDTIVAAPGLPRLTIEWVSTIEIQISWLLSASEWILQSSCLIDGDWQTSNLALTSGDDSVSVTVPTSEAQQFFRLTNP